MLNQCQDNVTDLETTSMRVVGKHQCNILKRNFILLLNENSADSKQSFNCQDFITIFKKILPSSPSDQVKKLFDILQSESDLNVNNGPKTISFDQMLNNPHNFTKLLHSMCCVTEEENNDHPQSDTEEYSHMSQTMLVHTYSMDDDDTDHDEEINTTQMQKDVYVMGALEEDNTILPQLSWKHRRSAVYSSKQSTIRSYNNGYKATRNATYNEYMQHHKEQINELQNRINELETSEIKCNELQLLLDTRNREIGTQKEEIKQLTEDKDYYFEEVDNLRNKYDELLEQYAELDDVNHHVTKVHKIQHESTQFMEEQVEELMTIYHESQEFGFKLREEKHELNKLNTRYAEINDHLRQELEAQKDATHKLKLLMDAKDTEIRNITLDSLSKDQKIQSLQVENQYLKQNDSYLIQATSNASLDTHSSYGWMYGATTIHGGSRRASVCLEFDLFEEIDVCLYNGDSGSRRASLYNNEIVDMNEMDDEKMSEAGHATSEYSNLVDKNHKIHELERKPKLQSIATQTNKELAELGFWDKLLRNVGYLCVPTDSAYDTIPYDVSL